MSRRFEVSWHKALRDMRETFRKWENDEWDVLRTYHGVKTRNLTPEQRRVTVVWQTNDRAARHVEVSCDRWDDPADNLRALWYAVESIRMNEQRGVGDLAAHAYAQLPSPDPHRSALETLELPASIGPDDIPDAVRDSYRRLAKVHHPDVEGGDADRFKAITAARDELLGDAS